MKQQQHSPPGVTLARLQSHCSGACSVLTALLSAPRSAPTPAGAGSPPACSHTWVEAATQGVSIALLLLLHPAAQCAPCIKAPACMQGGRTPQCCSVPIPRGLRSSTAAHDMATGADHVFSALFCGVWDEQLCAPKITDLVHGIAATAKPLFHKPKHRRCAVLRCGRGHSVT